MPDYMLTGHRCRPIARMRMSLGRDCWLGELVEPIKGYPDETHCLHITTPAKSVVFGVMDGDMQQMAVLCQIVNGGPINPTWLGRMEKNLRHNAEAHV